jgi:N-acetylmuramoyl-L-alanine amidase
MAHEEVFESLSAVEILAVLVYGESRGEAIEGQIAVANVVRNRVRSGQHKTYQDIALAPYQFSCFNVRGGGQNFTETLGAAQAMVSARGASKNPPNPPLLNQAVWIATGIITGSLLDNVHGANLYYAPDAMVPKGSVPSWVRSSVKVAEVGRQLFYKE